MEMLLLHDIVHVPYKHEVHVQQIHYWEKALHAKYWGGGLAGSNWGHTFCIGIQNGFKK